MALASPLTQTQSNMPFLWSSSKGVDDEFYRSVVLALPPDVTEDDIDEKTAQEARELGLLPLKLHTDIETIASSLSATTVSSDLNNKTSILSQSTDPTSCASSERKPVTPPPSFLFEQSPTESNTPSLRSDLERKHDSALRKGFRKMTTFRKRRSAVITSSTLTSINSDAANTTNSDGLSIESALKSPASIKSSKSSWSSPPSATKSAYQPLTPVDPEAVRRSLECKEMLDLQSRQLEERTRFLEYQRIALSQLRVQHDTVKQKRTEVHNRLVEETLEKNEKAVEELESRQLEEEIKLVKEFEMEKRTVMIRLRHMEAYCQNPTPPPTPIDPSSGRPSMEQQLPERRVTDKDYHNLAQQYRERDVMDTLHASKINVLRGKQKKAVENFMLKREREIELMERGHLKEIENLEREHIKEEAGIRMAFGLKRARLESRWRFQASVERSKMERLTGLSHHPLPDVFAVDDHRTLLQPW